MSEPQLLRNRGGGDKARTLLMRASGRSGVAPVIPIVLSTYCGDLGVLSLSAGVRWATWNRMLGNKLSQNHPCPWIKMGLYPWWQAPPTGDSSHIPSPGVRGETISWKAVFWFPCFVLFCCCRGGKTLLSLPFWVLSVGLLGERILLLGKIEEEIGSMMVCDKVYDDVDF